MSNDSGTPDAVRDARQLAARVLSSLHADAAPEFAYPDLSREQAIAATERELAEAYAAYHKCLTDNRAELGRLAEFAADYGEIDEPAPYESRWTTGDLELIPLPLHDDPPF
ncbi:hypothetical protein ACWELJ_25850 [Nocardia sp. NPDC004582]